MFYLIGHRYEATDGSQKARFRGVITTGPTIASCRLGIATTPMPANPVDDPLASPPWRFWVNQQILNPRCMRHGREPPISYSTSICFDETSTTCAVDFGGKARSPSDRKRCFARGGGTVAMVHSQNGPPTVGPTAPRYEAVLLNPVESSQSRQSLITLAPQLQCTMVRPSQAGLA